MFGCQNASLARAPCQESIKGLERASHTLHPCLGEYQMRSRVSTYSGPQRRPSTVFAGRRFSPKVVSGFRQARHTGELWLTVKFRNFNLGSNHTRAVPGVRNVLAGVWPLASSFGRFTLRPMLLWEPFEPVASAFGGRAGRSGLLKAQEKTRQQDTV